jgi:CxxC motif-containing protein (DUF1111 family)
MQMGNAGKPRGAALLSTLLAAMLLAGCGGGGGSAPSAPPTPPAAEPDWALITALGGATTNTTGNQSSFGFDTPAPNLDAGDLALHQVGDAQFAANFIKAPSNAFPLQDGVGPVFNNTSCLNCHARDGRANFNAEILSAGAGAWTKLSGDAGLFLRLSLNGAQACTPSAANDYCAPQPVPGFGTQLFHRGVLGARTDSPFSGLADVYVRFEQHEVRYGDGTAVTLSKPVFQIRNPYDRPGEAPATGVTPASRLLQGDVATSPRMGQPMFGLGLLEAINEADILALADPEDRDGDGISGRPNWVLDPVKRAQGVAEPRALGRFGWKASTPSVLVQGASAYRGDMGVTNYLFPLESIAGTPLYDTYRIAHPDDDGQAAGGHEAGEDIVKHAVFYASTLAVPARRDVDNPTVRRGATLFASARCTACHTPSFTTGQHPGIWGPSGRIAVKAVQGQKIHPFTDLLLHDMGAGLADGRSDFQANGREWRTRPLWGIGLTHTVNPLAGFLHDGRARSLEEAILWHGGEAEAAKERFRTMTAEERAALIAFLRSL